MSPPTHLVRRPQELDRSLGPTFFPERGLGEQVPTDALLYRLYEIIRVFGYPIKSVIHEKFGDGSVSCSASCRTHAPRACGARSPHARALIADHARGLVHRAVS